jgi:hypothetical protein
MLIYNPEEEYILGEKIHEAKIEEPQKSNEI